MRCFFDTSAVVPLLIDESHTSRAGEIWSRCEEAWAWDWMVVEAEATLSRRRADAKAWQSWKALSSQFRLTSLASDRMEALCAFNRALALRAADAGHLFICDRLCGVLPDLEFVSFDGDLIAAAEQIGLSVSR